MVQVINVIGIIITKYGVKKNATGLTIMRYGEEI